jgi:RHS repeat-associated protein
LQAHSVSQREKNLFQRRYTYDANGNLAGIDDSRKGHRSYHYDPLDRLINVRGATPESFAHDPAGNLLGQNNEPTANLANVKGNRLLMQGDRHYDYDAYGNLIRERRGAGQKLVTEYRYDCQHRLIGVSLPGGSVASYKYDAFGRRIEKTVDGHTTEFLWQGERLIAESADNRYRSYIYEPGSFRPLVMLDGEGPLKAAPFYYQLDHLGTPQELTDYSGEIMWSAKYRAYGNLAALDVAEIDNPLRFQGQYFDAETGLHYNRHRYYNPGTGRFLTPDPIQLAGGLNNYQYVPNPTGWVDPLGLSGNCPDADKKLSLGETPDSSSGSNVHAAGPATPPAPANPPGQGYHNEVYASKPVKPQDAAGKWHDFLGEGPYTNIHPRTGLPDNDRLVSADGKRSIRYGAHEMNSKPNKHHYHEETWTLDLINNVMNVDNTVVRVPLGTK